MVNSSRVGWSDVWLWPIRLAEGRFMTDTAISLSLSLPHTYTHTHALSRVILQTFTPCSFVRCSCVSFSHSLTPPWVLLIYAISNHLMFSFLTKSFCVNGMQETQIRQKDISKSTHGLATDTHTHRRTKISKRLSVFV